MTKWNEFVEKIKRPSPETLAKVEYRSHFLNMIGITFVCIGLIYQGFWYVIFAFVFTIGVSYAQGMSAYMKYQVIKQVMEGRTINPSDIESPTRRRSFIIRETFGEKPAFIAALISVCLTTYSLSSVWPKVSWMIYLIIYAIILTFIYVVVYYFPMYWISNYFYNRMKGGNKNGKT